MFRTIAALTLVATSTLLPAETAWQTWAKMTDGPGNITVSKKGRVFVSMHQFFGHPTRVAEVKPDGTWKPFPSAELSTFDAAEPLSLDSVLGLMVDEDDVLWMLDNGMREKSTPKLVGWDLDEDELERVIHFPSTVTRPDSFLNDLAVDEERDTVYIADPAGGANAALIVVDLETGESRRLLEGHESVVPDLNVDLSIDGKAVKIKRPDGTTFHPKVGVNPLAIDAKGEWLYFGPMHGKTLYRVKTKALRDRKLDGKKLAAKVEAWAQRPVSDGISIDRKGNVYISDVAANAIGVIHAKDRRYEVLASDPAISWPDAFSFGPDGNMYVVANQLHLSPTLNGGVNEVKPPYLLFTFKPLAPGVVGR